jgi:hypothetical protein
VKGVARSVCAFDPVFAATEILAVKPLSPAQGRTLLRGFVNRSSLSPEHLRVTFATKHLNATSALEGRH